MQTIFPISAHIISRIAAGEVIERPVYAVKELIENSLDAGADTITIQIEESGLKKIVVTDNGVGMSKDDLLESFKPHTTSKLVEDLIGISTFGFRGEALASIASISDMTIQSKEKGEAAGMQVVLKSGVVDSIKPAGMPEGTSVTIHNLFHSVPARKKFLKSDRTEFRHIAELVTQYAIANPEVKFVLLHNKKVIFDLPKVQSNEKRFELLFGAQVSSHLIPILADEPYVRVEGFIAHPQLSTSAATKQYIFVNGRSITDRLIASAVKDAYGSLLETTRHPVFIVSLSLPYESVDVNIHPRKEQVGYVNNTLIFDVVKSAVTKTLQENNLTFFNASFARFSPRIGTTKSYAAEILRDAVNPWTVKDEILLDSDITQIHDTYLLIQSKKGMILIDQHAAHERVLYEQYLSEFQKEKTNPKSFVLPHPVVIDLPFTEIDKIMENLSFFEQYGFEIEQFAPNSYRINAVPELLKDRDIRILILDLLEEIDSTISLDSFSHTMIAFLACRGAIMAGEKLTKKEALKLIEKLKSTPNNATCPHGRPTKIEVSVHDLHKMFKRE